jgi:hypothetical protein
VADAALAGDPKAVVELSNTGGALGSRLPAWGVGWTSELVARAFLWANFESSPVIGVSFSDG